MTWQAWVTTLAVTLEVTASWRYLRAVIAGKTDPRLASWAIWTAAMTTGAIAAARAGAIAAAALGAAGAALAAVILAAGWQHGTREFDRVDAAGTVTGSTGILLLTAAAIWPRAVPLLAVITVSVLTDAAAFTPTWQGAHRGTEVPGPWLGLTAAAVLTLACAHSLAGTVYPAYETAACLTAVLLAVRAGDPTSTSGPPSSSPPPSPGPHPGRPRNQSSPV